MDIALVGYGKMGHEIERVALGRGHRIVSIIDIDNRGDFNSEAFRKADVAIEFSAPGAAYSNVKAAIEAGVKVVSGTTGWFKDAEQEMKFLCDNGATLFWSSNFSVGMCIFSAVNRYLAHIMNDFGVYDVRMTETHHIHKLDAPSGTAITLAEAIEEEIDRIEKVPIESIREGEVPGIHSIRYDSTADSITITHDAKNRTGLALGAVLAAEFTVRHNGLLGMKDLFNF